MKKFALITLLALTIPLAAGAQTQTVSPGQIQQILQSAQQQSGGRIKINTATIMAVMGMHQCMREKIGDEGLKRMGERGKALNDKVKPLCDAGERDEAMAMQIAFAKDTMQTPEYAGVKVCAEQYKEALSDPMFSEVRAMVERPDQTTRNICDYQKKPAVAQLPPQ